jgi:hypothetical protein
VQYVDNSGIRYNCRELVDEFYAAVRDDGRIDLNFVGGLTWWLGVRYTYDLATGAASADQEAFIDKLLEQYTVTNCNPCVLPMAVGTDLASIPLPDVPDKDIVAAYAKLVGELLYISINTVPEIMYALSALTRFMTRGCQASQINVVCTNRQSPVSAWSALWLRRCKLGRRQVFAPQHAMLCVVLQRRSFFMEISSCSYPRCLYK